MTDGHTALHSPSTSASAAPDLTQHLGRFGHHPDPGTDFCVEVDRLEGQAYEVGVGLADRQCVALEIDRAMTFIAKAIPHAVAAKANLRELEREVGRPSV